MKKKEKKTERELWIVTYNAGYVNRDNYEIKTTTKQTQILSRLEDLQEDIEHLDERYEWVEILSIMRVIKTQNN